ncbi:hypothetical protein BLNAU_23636 [Blattamonas nauphoetae]|uniref:Uncharacterized protein n=1 Tax=Blattamonas nauphoetae TaxID=2049346 RepID=A0ABQ9WQ53_9EUKA|nr:hypothetical protein BLNAU_23636 [Blattamonas nauphoetae]
MNMTSDSFLNPDTSVDGMYNLTGDGTPRELFLISPMCTPAIGPPSPSLVPITPPGYNPWSCVSVNDPTHHWTSFFNSEYPIGILFEEDTNTPFFSFDPIDQAENVEEMPQDVPDNNNNPKKVQILDGDDESEAESNESLIGLASIKEPTSTSPFKISPTIFDSIDQGIVRTIGNSQNWGYDSSRKRHLLTDLDPGAGIGGSDFAAPSLPLNSPIAARDMYSLGSLDENVNEAIIKEPAYRPVLTSFPSPASKTAAVSSSNNGIFVTPILTGMNDLHMTPAILPQNTPIPQIRTARPRLPNYTLEFPHFPLPNMMSPSSPMYDRSYANSSEEDFQEANGIPPLTLPPRPVALYSRKTAPLAGKVVNQHHTLWSEPGQTESDHPVTFLRTRAGPDMKTYVLPLSTLAPLPPPPSLIPQPPPTVAEALAMQARFLSQVGSIPGSAFLGQMGPASFRLTEQQRRDVDAMEAICREMMARRAHSLDRSVTMHEDLPTMSVDGVTEPDGMIIVRQQSEKAPTCATIHPEDPNSDSKPKTRGKKTQTKKTSSLSSSSNTAGTPFQAANPFTPAEEPASTDSTTAPTPDAVTVWIGWDDIRSGRQFSFSQEVAELSEQQRIAKAILPRNHPRDMPGAEVVRKMEGSTLVVEMRRERPARAFDCGRWSDADFAELDSLREHVINTEHRSCAMGQLEQELLFVAETATAMGFPGGIRSVRVILTDVSTAISVRRGSCNKCGRTLAWIEANCFSEVANDFRKRLACFPPSFTEPAFEMGMKTRKPHCAHCCRIDHGVWTCQCGSLEEMGGKTRWNGRYEEWVYNILMSWRNAKSAMSQGTKRVFTSKVEKCGLMEMTGLNAMQVLNWASNRRNRLRVKDGEKKRKPTKRRTSAEFVRPAPDEDSSCSEGDASFFLDGLSRNDNEMASDENEPIRKVKRQESSNDSEAESAYPVLSANEVSTDQLLDQSSLRFPSFASPPIFRNTPNTQATGLFVQPSSTLTQTRSEQETAVSASPTTSDSFEASQYLALGTDLSVAEKEEGGSTGTAPAQVGNDTRNQSALNLLLPGDIGIPKWSSSRKF